MNFKKGDICYILENNMNVRTAKISRVDGNFYTIQLVGSCGAIRLPKGRLFKTEEAALQSRKTTPLVNTEIEDDFGYVDVFKGRRTGKSPH